MALAGGAALTFPGTGYLYEQGLVNSIDGKVRPFDAAASGTVFGDAVGAVVLKRLADAVRDGDAPLATLKGFGVTNDGARRAGGTRRGRGRRRGPRRPCWCGPPRRRRPGSRGGARRVRGSVTR